MACGNPDQRSEEALRLCQSLGDRRKEAVVLNNFALLSLLRGKYNRAAALSSESLAQSRELLDHVGVTACPDTLAALCAAQGDVVRAVRLWGAAEVVLGDQGSVASDRLKEVLIASWVDDCVSYRVQTRPQRSLDSRQL